MARARATVINEERPFGIHELFFSTTNPNGIIRAGNRVFARVSGWSSNELIGQPHNILRHPDMPRVVFKLLWDEIGAGRPVVAYVKNLARTGAYYWVIASVVPVEGGYLSVRFKPSSALFPTVSALYAQLLKIEQDIERAGGSKVETMAASGKALDDALKGLGFESYRDFMYAFVPSEVKSRDAEMARQRHTVAADALDAEGDLGTIAEHVAEVRTFLHDEFAHMGSFIELGDALVEKARFVNDLSKNVRLISQNVSISARRRELAGRPLAVVGDTIREQADAVGQITTGLTTRIHELSKALHRQAFRISISRLQAQTMSTFIAELNSGSTASLGETHVGSAFDSLAALSECLTVDARVLFDDHRAMAKTLAETATEASQLQDRVRTLNMIRMTGRVEVSRLPDPAEFAVLFDTIETQLAEADERLSELSEAMVTIKGATSRALAQEGDVRGRLDKVALAAGRLRQTDSATPPAEGAGA